MAAAPSAAAPSGPRAAQGARAAAPSADSLEVRLGLSRAAVEEVAEARVRRLLEIELPEGASLATAPIGPLGDRAAYVWIDRPTPSRLEIQVRLGGRAVLKRQIAVSGLTSDVAARLVAIAASEMIRTELLRAHAPRRPASPRRPKADEIDRASRDLDALNLTAALHGALITGRPGALGGAGVSLGFRRLRATQSLFARWLASPDERDALRWAEVGLAGEYRFWLGASLRLSLGAAASVASLRLPHAASVDGLAGQRASWSARAGLGLGVEARLGGPAWLGLTLEPGAVLRPAPYVDDQGAARAVEGAWLGVGLSIGFEQRSTAGR